jgi:hypothetical protein
MKIQINNEINKLNIDGTKYQTVEILSNFEDAGIDINKINFIKNKFKRLLNGKNKGRNKIFLQKAKNIAGKDYALASFGYHLVSPKDIKNYYKKQNILFFTCKLYN